MRPREHSGDDDVRTPARGALRPGWAVGCWLFVLLAIGIVQIVRLQWFDATVFFAAVAGIALVATGTIAPGHGSHRVTLPVISIVAAVLGAAAGALPRHGVLMQALVIAIGIAAVLLAASGRSVAHPAQATAFSRGIRRLALAWAIIVVLGCVWELIQFILGLVQPDAAWFSLSDLLNPLVATMPGKIVIVIAWLAGGVWLLRRGGRR